jgi:hypothetical protein
VTIKQNKQGLDFRNYLSYVISGLLFSRLTIWIRTKYQQSWMVFISILRLGARKVRPQIIADIGNQGVESNVLRLIKKGKGAYEVINDKARDVQRMGSGAHDDRVDVDLL